jgi:methyl-accepting chemotaxis protein
LSQFIDKFIPNDYKKSIFDYQKAKLLITILLILCISTFSGAIVVLLGKEFSLLMFLSCLISSLFLLGLGYLFKRNKKSIKFITNLSFIPLIFLLNIDFYTTTDFIVSTSHFLSIIPLLSLLLVGNNDSKKWLFFILLNNTFNLISRANGLWGLKIPDNYDLISHASLFIIFALMIYGISKSFEESRKILMSELESEKNSIASKVEEAVKEVEVKNKEVFEISKQTEEANKKLEFNHQKLLSAMEESENTKKDLEINKQKIEEEQKVLEHNVQTILEKMNKFAEGDLTVQIEIEEKDSSNSSINKLFQGFNLSVQNINQLFKHIVEAIEKTKTSSDTIILLTQQLAAGTEEQLIQTGHIASSAEELAATTEQNAKSILMTAQNSNKNKEMANSGGQIVSKTVDTMKEIADIVNQTLNKVSDLYKSTTRINEIISVINDIANQTNLLALNAAIESARAGEHGRGFSVVAGEVRKLSEKTTLSTKEIESMINSVKGQTNDVVSVMKEVTQRVNRGISLTNNAGDALDKIVTSSEQLLTTMEQISVSTEQHSATTKQIAKNILEIDYVSNKAVEDIDVISKSASELNDLIVNLEEISRKFKTK